MDQPPPQPQVKILPFGDDHMNLFNYGGRVDKFLGEFFVATDERIFLLGATKKNWKGDMLELTGASGVESSGVDSTEITPKSMAQRIKALLDKILLISIEKTQLLTSLQFPETFLFLRNEKDKNVRVLMRALPLSARKQSTANEICKELKDLGICKVGGMYAYTRIHPVPAASSSGQNSSKSSKGGSGGPGTSKNGSGHGQDGGSGKEGSKSGGTSHKCGQELKRNPESKRKKKGTE